MARGLETELAEAQGSFLSLVAEIRPELHRYCSRLTGSVIDGEDLVQETLARGFYALGQTLDLPALRPWLFRIAHHAAVDLLKSHGRRFSQPRADLEDIAGYHERADPAVVRAALGQFLSLPIQQRSATILKDVLGHSLEETAETMGTTVLAVKAALVRGRAKLRQTKEVERRAERGAREELHRYASLFNARDWDGVRDLVAEDCRLDLVSRAQRRGKEVGAYYGRYEKERVQLEVGWLEGRMVLAAFEPATPTSRRRTVPRYFIFLNWEGGRVVGIRDFRYVPYIAAEARYRRWVA